jgi:hypothetical protein
MSSPTTAGKTPARVTFSCLTPNNVGVVRKLNSVLFPVKYAEKYYKDILTAEVEEFCQLGERRPLNRAWQNPFLFVFVFFCFVFATLSLATPGLDLTGY